jgi:hypothetical protein
VGDQWKLPIVESVSRFIALLFSVSEFEKLSTISSKFVSEMKLSSAWNNPNAVQPFVATFRVWMRYASSNEAIELSNPSHRKRISRCVNQTYRT